MSLKLEVGKYYKTQGGRKAFVAAVELGNPFGTSSNLPALVHYSDNITHNVYPDGRFSLGGEHPRDIVAEWCDPITVSGWVNVYDRRRSTICSTRDFADTLDKGVPERRIACIYITGIEGDTDEIGCKKRVGEDSTEGERTMKYRVYWALEAQAKYFDGDRIYDNEHDATMCLASVLDAANILGIQDYMSEAGIEEV